MTYKIGNKSYIVEYQIVDDHQYEIFLIDDDGNDLDFYELDAATQEDIWSIVEQDAIEAQAENYFENWKSFQKYGDQ